MYKGGYNTNGREPLSEHTHFLPMKSSADSLEYRGEKGKRKILIAQQRRPPKKAVNGRKQWARL